MPISAETHAQAARRHVEAAMNGRTSRDILDIMLRIEGVAPGFAGYFIEKDTILVALLVNLENEGRLRTATAELKESHEPGRFNTLSLTKVLRVSPAKYSVSQLVAWQDLMWRTISKFDVLSLVHVDITHNKVRIGISEAAGESVMWEAMRKLGVPSDAVRVEVVGRFHTL